MPRPHTLRQDKPEQVHELACSLTTTSFLGCAGSAVLTWLCQVSSLDFEQANHYVFMTGILSLVYQKLGQSRLAQPRKHSYQTLFLPHSQAPLLQNMKIVLMTGWVSFLM